MSFKDVFFLHYRESCHWWAVYVYILSVSFFLKCNFIYFLFCCHFVVLKLTLVSEINTCIYRSLSLKKRLFSLKKSIKWCQSNLMCVIRCLSCGCFFVVVLLVLKKGSNAEIRMSVRLRPNKRWKISTVMRFHVAKVNWNLPFYGKK